MCVSLRIPPMLEVLEGHARVSVASWILNLTLSGNLEVFNDYGEEGWKQAQRTHPTLLSCGHPAL